MIARFRSFAAYFIFWIIYFIVLKLLFLIYFHNISTEHIGLWHKVFIHGFRLDMSATGYITLLPILMLLASVWFRGNWFRKVLRIYSILLLSAFTLLAIIDLVSYNDWGSRLDASTLFYVSKPKEAIASVSAWFIVIHVLLYLSILSVFIVLFNRVFSKQYLAFKTVAWWNSPAFLLLFGLMVLPIRGGLGTAPINVGSTYFSNINFANHAAINLPWNFGFSITNLETVDNPFRFMDQQKARKLVNEWIYSDSTRIQLLNKRRPNIILIILESFTANATGCLGGQPPVTPNLDRMADKGILFKHMYASGSRTDKGMIAILSGFPAQPTTSIIKFPNKTQKLPSLPHALKKFGYTTSYYYGGDIEFANYQSYLLNAGFETLFSMDDFPASQRTSSWGVPDEFLFQKAYEDIMTVDTPYFKTLFTLSSHAPYDIPMEPHLEGDSQDILFCNSMYYTDYHLGNFIDSLEKHNKLDNTLVICVADHGSTWPGRWSNYRPEKFHIPMVWYGSAVTSKGVVNEAYASQTDIATTLLKQLNISSEAFNYGRDLFTDTPPQAALYAYNNGFGVVSDSLIFYYHREPNTQHAIHGELSEVELNQGKAYMQIVYDDLINKY